MWPYVPFRLAPPRVSPLVVGNREVIAEPSFLEDESSLAVRHCFALGPQTGFWELRVVILRESSATEPIRPPRRDLSRQVGFWEVGSSSQGLPTSAG